MKFTENIIHLLKTATNIDFSFFDAQYLQKQILTHQRDLGMSEPDYLEQIHENPKLQTELFSYLTNSTTSFFRDTLSLEIFSKRLIRQSLVENRNNTSLRIWSCGCSTGEEPYTIAMILENIIERWKMPLKYFIMATDINKESLHKAEKGIYQEATLKDIPYGLFQSYFSKINDNNYQIHENLKKHIHFSHYDIFDPRPAPPDSIFGQFDAIFCCNLLIYINPEHHLFLITKLHKALKNSSYLILGETESLPVAGEEHFRLLTEYSRIYKKLP